MGFELIEQGRCQLAQVHPPGVEHRTGQVHRQHPETLDVRVRSIAGPDAAADLRHLSECCCELTDYSWAACSTDVDDVVGVSRKPQCEHQRRDLFREPDCFVFHTVGGDRRKLGPSTRRHQPISRSCEDKRHPVRNEPLGEVAGPIFEDGVPRCERHRQRSSVSDEDFHPADDTGR